MLEPGSLSAITNPPNVREPNRTIVNDILRATTVAGYRARMVEAIPIGRIVEICRRQGPTKP